MISKVLLRQLLHLTSTIRILLFKLINYDNFQLNLVYIETLPNFKCYYENLAESFVFITDIECQVLM